MRGERSLNLASDHDHVNELNEWSDQSRVCALPDGCPSPLSKAPGSVIARATRARRPSWTFDAGAPVLSAPLVDSVQGRERVFFSAGQTFFALDATSGDRVWSVPGRGFSSGRAAGDGRRVYTAADDGFARAHDARTGEQVWAYSMVTGTENHLSLYSGWDNVVVVADGVAWAQSVDGKLLGVRLADGTRQGRLQRSLVYSFSTPALAGNLLVVGDQNGVVAGISLP